MIAIEPAGDDARQFFARLDVAAGDLRPALDRIGERFLDEEQELFDRGGPAGAWKPLTPSYLRQRVRQGKGSQIMRIRSARGGVIEKSLTVKNGPRQDYEVRSDRLVVASTAGIAAVHHRGGVRTARWRTRRGKQVVRTFRIPARPLTNIDSASQRDYAALLQDHFVDGGPR